MEPAKEPVAAEDGANPVKGDPEEGTPSVNKSAPPSPKPSPEEHDTGVSSPAGVGASLLSVLHYPPPVSPAAPPPFGKPTPQPRLTHHTNTTTTQSLLPTYRRGVSSEGGASASASAMVGGSSSAHRPFTALALGRAPLLLPAPSASPSAFHGRLRVLLLQSGDHPLRHTLILDRLALHTTVGQVLELVAQELVGPPSPSSPPDPSHTKTHRARVASVRDELRALHPYGNTGASPGSLVLEEWVLLSTLDFTRLTEPALVLQRRVRALLAPSPAPSSPVSEPEGANNELGLPRHAPSAPPPSSTSTLSRGRLLLRAPSGSALEGSEEEEEGEVEGVVCMTCLDLLEGPVKDRGSHCGAQSSGYSTHHMCFLCISRMMDTDPARFRPESSSSGGSAGLSLVFQCPHPDCRQRHRLTSLHQLSPPVLSSFLQRASSCVTCGQPLEDRALAPRCQAGHGHCDDCLQHKVRWGLEGGEQPYDGALPCECVLAEGAARCSLRIPRDHYMDRLPSSLRVWVTEEMLRERAALVAGYEQDFPPSAEAVTLFLEETILNLRCPHCRKAFSDHSACPSVRCSSCRLDFCARCLRRREHCPGFDKDHSHEEWHTERRTRRLVGYLLGYDCSEELLHDIFNPAFRQLLRSIGLEPDTIVESVTLGRRSITQTLLLQQQQQHTHNTSGGPNTTHHNAHHRSYSRSGSSGGGGSGQSHAPHSTAHPRPSAFRALSASSLARGGEGSYGLHGDTSVGQEEGTHEEGGAARRGPLSRENSGGRSALLLNSMTNLTRHRPSQHNRSGSGDWSGTQHTHTGAGEGYVQRRVSDSLRIGEEEGQGEEEASGGGGHSGGTTPRFTQPHTHQHSTDTLSPNRHHQKGRGRVGVGPFPALPSPSLPPTTTPTSSTSTGLRGKDTGLLLPLGGVEEEEEEGDETTQGGEGTHTGTRQTARSSTLPHDTTDRRNRTAATGATGARAGGSLQARAGTTRASSEQANSSTSTRSGVGSSGARGEEGGLEGERWGMVIKTESPASSLVFVLLGCANLFVLLLAATLTLLLMLANATHNTQPKTG